MAKETPKEEILRKGVKEPEPKKTLKTQLNKFKKEIKEICKSLWGIK